MLDPLQNKEAQPAMDNEDQFNKVYKPIFVEFNTKRPESPEGEYIRMGDGAFVKVPIEEIKELMRFIEKDLKDNIGVVVDLQSRITDIEKFLNIH